MRAAWTISLAVLCCGCQLRIDHSGNRYRCTLTPECPGQLLCVDGQCVPPTPEPSDGAVDSAVAVPDAAAPLTGGDVLLYTFDNVYDPARVIHDRSGNRFDGTRYGTTDADGRHGRGRYFDGAGNNLRIPNTPDLFVGTSVTIEAWINHESTGVDEAIISDWNPGTTAPEVELSFELTAANALQLVSNDGSAPVVALSTATVPDAVWTHAAATWDGIEARFYIDGALVDTVPFAHTPANSTATRPYRVGRRTDGTARYRGTLDELKLSRVVKSERDIAASMNHDSTADLSLCGDHLIETEDCDTDALCCEASTCAYSAADTPCGGGSTCNQNGLCQVAGGRVTDGLVALYQFDDGSGTTVSDSVAPALDLTIDDLGATGAYSWQAGYLHIDTAILIASYDVDGVTPIPASKIYAQTAGADDAITIEAWVAPANTTQSGPARIVSMSQDTGARNFLLGQSAQAFTVRLRTARTDGNGEPMVVTPTGDVATALTHLIFTRDPAGVRHLYINGVERSRTTVLGNLNWDDTLPLNIANELTGDRAFLGDLHLVAIYGRALTAGEVARNYQAGAD